MALFQTSVLQKYLAEQDNDLLLAQYNIFISYFLNPTIQNNIIAQKEEQFQEGFLRELFVKVLGYTINPEPDFNLTTELKNIKDAKKADGAIIDKEKVLAVIELKGTDTTNLTKIEQQAFNYKNNQDGCRYVITSNFQKLRFYIDNAIEFIEWDLFKLDLEGFCLLNLCLAKVNIFNDLPAKIKTESVTVEDNITKQLYKKYSQFRKSLFNNIVELNTTIEKLLLFKKTQKLLDRFLFLFFAEDRLLVPPNSVRLILDQWTELKDKYDEYQPLYDRFKKYFGYLNTGYVGKQHEIFAYNGGLFAPDELLDNISIKDEILFQATLGLSNYDYNSEVDVNILGHIFEHSLTEIEELEREITSSEKVESKTTKRKKDGVFYTPKYITKYIVENTVGTLCKNKKEELKLQEEDYHKLTKKAKKQLYDNLKQYREWLLHITIIDPACGSGAFLNQALDFLIQEHRWIAELEANIFNTPMVFDVESSILENNLFGVDINEESVEIAKLSLWLRTARKGRKLNSLNSNIKCGNSLIDDPAVAGDKAFNWENEFPHIFEKGGFDVVIGNPPYGAKLTNIEKKYFDEKYNITQYNYDTYSFFFEISLFILKKLGYLGFITPNTFLVVENGDKLRRMLFEQNTILKLFEIYNVFSDAVVEPIVSIFKKQVADENNIFEVSLTERNINSDKYYELTDIINFKQTDLFQNSNLIFNYKATEKKRDIFEKIARSSKPLSEYAKVTTGVKPYQVGKGSPLQTKETVLLKPFTGFKKVNEEWKQLVRGTQVNRYSLKWDGEYIKYGKFLAEPRQEEVFFRNKLFIRRTDDKILTVYDDAGFVGLNSIHTIQLKSDKIELLTLMSILNSKLCTWAFQFQNFHMVGKPMAEVKVIFVERLPIIVPEDQQSFMQNADLMLSKNKEFQLANTHFYKLLNSKFENLNINNKLEKWYELSFADYNKELYKQKIKLSLSEQSEWLTFFEQEKQKALAIKNEIDKTDKEIDQMVYQLYGLTDEEIKIVEGK